MSKKILLFFIFLGLSSTSLFSQAINTSRLDSLFDALSKNNKTMGSVAIAKNGKIIYTRSLGYSNISDNENTPASSKTLYRIGSITKMFTATMIFQLIEENRISLNTNLKNFFPNIPNANKITIRTLLNHRSGLFDFVDDQDPVWLTRPQTKQMIVSKIIKGKIHFLPNENFSYSNTGYLLLAYIIEKITNQTYNENLQKRICKKIQLKNTYSPANNKLKNNEANSFAFSNSKWKKVTDIYFPNVVGVGDILSTPSDLIKFDEALLSGKLISQTSLDSMKTFANNTFGMGIMKVPFYSKIGYGHAGDTYGTHTLVANFPSDSLTLASCFNGENYPHNEINIDILHICFNEKYEMPTFKTFEIPEELLNKYVGVYSSNDLPLKITITKEYNNLFAQATGQADFPLEAIEKNQFRFVPAGIVMTFDIEKNEVIMKQGGRSYRFTKDK